MKKNLKRKIIMVDTQLLQVYRNLITKDNNSQQCYNIKKYARSFAINVIDSNKNIDIFKLENTQE